MNILKSVWSIKPNWTVDQFEHASACSPPPTWAFRSRSHPSVKSSNPFSSEALQEHLALECASLNTFQDWGVSGTITLTQPSITVFLLSVTKHDTAIKAMNRFSLFTSAEAKTTSPTYKGAGKLISCESNTQPGPGILVPRRAEISPLTKTPCTIVFPNLVCFAKSSFKCKGLTSPVNSENTATSLCVKALLSSARSPTLTCVCSVCCLLSTGWLRQILLWSPPRHRRWQEITGNIFSTIKFQQSELLDCFGLQTAYCHQNVLLRAKECFCNGRLFNPILVPYYYQIRQGEMEKPVREKKNLRKSGEKTALKHRACGNTPSFLG